MHITSLAVSNVRIIRQCDIDLTKGVTVFVGDNGQGKTSLLEAMYWASHTKSFRHVANDDVIRKGAESAHIKVRLTDDERPQDIVATLNRVGRDSVLVNGQKLRRNRDLLGTLRVSIFTPDDLDIIKGSSSLRRDVFDDTLHQISPKYVAAHADYSRALKQKNALLKSQEYEPGVLDVLNASIVSSGSQILRGRLVALSQMRNVLQSSYHHISGENSDIGVRYIAKVFDNDHGQDSDPDEDLTAEEIAVLFAAKIEEYSSIEARRCHSVVGPHRDDLYLSINDRDTRTQASQGEQRSMALALKMALHKVVHATTGDNPILLLDDVFSELDIGRTHRLIECLPAAQTFVTTATDIPSTLKVDETFSVIGGDVSKSS
ncbi:MAG TPA: DNA replication/repair protein RecF [Acidimicrobiia bacterium]|nr:DNA replication/repair protein RecF [Acidimicrobiia bacterium]